jgi:hypothetical protein
MALSNPRTLFGVHSFTPYKIETGEHYGTVKVLQNSSLSLAGELIPLTAGSSRYPWAIEDGLITSELSLSFSQYEDFLIEIMLGKAPTANAAEANGNVSTIANKYGTSVVNATTGIASVAATTGDEADLKFGKYLVKVTDGAADKVTVYCASDIDFSRGTAGAYVSDDLDVAAEIVIPGTGGTVTLADYGLEFTGGSGTVSLTDGDTALFEVRPPNSKSMDVTIGGASDSFPSFGAIVVAQKRGGGTGAGELFEIDLFRLKAIGLPIGFASNEWSTAEVTAQAYYDSAKNGIFSMRHVSTI